MIASQKTVARRTPTISLPIFGDTAPSSFGKNAVQLGVRKSNGRCARKAEWDTEEEAGPASEWTSCMLSADPAGQGAVCLPTALTLNPVELVHKLAEGWMLNTSCAPPRADPLF